MKKGQAAMEFLMTYGWAILIAIIAVGVLWYLIGNPANLVGTRFTITDPFVKSAVAIQTTGVILEVRNGAGEQVTVNSVNVTSCGIYSTATPITDQALQSFTVSCTLTTGSRFKGDVIMKYTTSASTVEQTATGSVSGKVA